MISVAVSEFITYQSNLDFGAHVTGYLESLVQIHFSHCGSEALAGNSDAVLFSPDRENTSAALRATGLEKH